MNAEKSDVESSKRLNVSTTFEAMGLSENLLRGIYACGYSKPSAVQQRAIEQIIKKRDLMMQAQSGTGKTAAFCIGLLQCLDTSSSSTQALVILPSRELVEQTQKVIQALGVYQNVTCYSCVGIEEEDAKHLNTGGVQVLLGMPYIISLIKNKQVHTDSIKLIVLDEAEDFTRQQVSELLACFQQRPQVVAVHTALLLPSNLGLTFDPVRIVVPRDQLALDGIKQYSIVVGKEEEKFDKLCDICNQVSASTSIIVFCNTRRKVDWIAGKMRKKFDDKVASIHVDLLYSLRSQVLEDFSSGKSKILIATDAYSRGIDFKHVSIVINYDFPITREAYMYRIGRCGRFGRKGVVMSIVISGEVRVMRETEQFYSIHIDEMPFPSGIGSLIKLGL